LARVPRVRSRGRSLPSDAVIVHGSPAASSARAASRAMAQAPPVNRPAS
jgi:hypothetical protein